MLIENNEYLINPLTVISAFPTTANPTYTKIEQKAISYNSDAIFFLRKLMPKYPDIRKKTLTEITTKEFKIIKKALYTENGGFKSFNISFSPNPDTMQ